RRGSKPPPAAADKSCGSEQGRKGPGRIGSGTSPEVESGVASGLVACSSITVTPDELFDPTGYRDWQANRPPLSAVAAPEWPPRGSAGPRPASEHHLQAELNDPLPIVGAGQLAECAAGRSRNGRGELRMIQSIDKFGVELEPQPLLDLGILDRRHIEVIYPGRANSAEGGRQRLDIGGELLARD